MDNKLFLDYSQFSAFMKCEYYWWERYRAQYTPEPKGKQNSDARTLGSLVHTGLQNWRQTGRFQLNEAQIAQFNPTPECLLDVNGLLAGYIAAYPREEFTKYYCEEPLKFPLIPGMDGLAKIDSYFNVAEPVTVESGLGDSFTLNPGWWIHEYKTKSPTKDVGKYLGSWRMNMQANFQMFALQGLTGEMPQGVLVNVLEKAPDYTPVRACRACKTRVELRDWQPTGDGFRCPQCGNVQDVDTTDKSRTVRVPKYYRIMVQRTLTEMERSKTDMFLVAARMQEMDEAMKERSDPEALRRTEVCVDQIWGNCEYFWPHSAGQSAAGYPGFVPREALEYVTR